VNRLLANLAVMLGGVALALVILELALRLLGFLPSSQMPDRLLGDRWVPNAPYHWTVEGDTRGRINRAGWRDHDYSERKPPGTTRILVIGDSYVDGFQVPLDSTFHCRLERALNERARPGRRIEVPAMGKGGFGTTQEYLIYKHWGARYDPDVVALVFIVNDWWDNAPVDSSIRVKPFFRDDGDSLRLDLSFSELPFYSHWERTQWLRRHSSVYSTLANAVLRLKQRYRPTVGEQGVTGRQGWYFVWNFLRSPPGDSIPAFRLTEKILARFAREVQADGRRFVLIDAGVAETEDRDELAAAAKDSTMDMDKTRRWLEAVGRRHGFEVLSLTDGFRAASRARPDRLWFGGPGSYGHWNGAGHTVAAQILTDYFARTLPDSVIGR
jgi:hypothetical protein